MLKKIVILISAQMLFIYLISVEQNVPIDQIIFPFSIIMVLISLCFTFIINPFDVKREGIRFFGVLAIKDKPVKNTGPYKLSLFNSFFVSTLCFVSLAVLVTCLYG